MQNYNSFNELAASQRVKDNSRTDLNASVSNVYVCNMSTVHSFKGIRGARKGLRLVVGSRDHGNPHVEAWAGKRFLAKIFIETETVKDKTGVDGII
jgi:hypothetical protein